LFGDLRVETLAREQRCGVDLPMQLGRDSGHKLPGEWPVRSLAAFLAEFEVIIDGLPKRLLHLGDALALKRDDVAGVDHLAVNDPSFAVEFDFADVRCIPSWRDSRLCQEPSQGFDGALVGFFLWVWPVKHGSDAAEGDPHSRSGTLGDLGTGCRKHGLDVPAVQK
jgi:hypothetical protein